MQHREDHGRTRFRRRLTGLLLAGLMIAAAAPSTAAASSAFVEGSCVTSPKGLVHDSCTFTANFRASPGETNDMTVTELPNDRFSFADLGSRISPGDGCSSRGPNRVICDVRAFASDPRGRFEKTIGPANVQTGDLDDAVDANGHFRVLGGTGNDFLRVLGSSPSTVSGDDGDDRLTSEASVGQVFGGNAGDDKVIGGDGRDEVRGGSGNDTVLGGGDNDLMSGNSGRDELLGGTGNDRMFGRSGNDRLFGNQGADRLQGNGGNDGLAGGSGSDRISGGTGADRLFGNSGNDRLRGNSGRDRYRGGPGNDRLRTVDGLRERVNCGGGFDIAVVDRIDALARCNSVDRF